jgi:hypothetical protein
MRSHRKNLILGGSGKVHIFCRIGLGIPGFRNVYVDLIVNSPVGVSFHIRRPCSSLTVVAVKIGLSFIISFIKKYIVVCGVVVGSIGRG